MAFTKSGENVSFFYLFFFLLTPSEKNQLNEQNLGKRNF